METSSAMQFLVQVYDHLNVCAVSALHVYLTVGCSSGLLSLSSALVCLKLVNEPPEVPGNILAMTVLPCANITTCTTAHATQ